MFGFCSERLKSLFPICKIVGNSDIGLCVILQRNSPLSQKSFSSKTPLFLAAKKDKLQENRSFKVSYLIKSCGLTPEIAVSVSERINFETPDRPDLVVGFLRGHGFTNAHISTLVKKCPSLLLVNVEKALLPKFDFYRSIGLFGVDLAQAVARNPDLLLRSLNKCIIPCYDILKSVLIDDEKVAKIFRRSAWGVPQGVLSYFAANVSILRALGVPQSYVSSLITSHPHVASCETSKFKKGIEKVTSLGFNPLKIAFVHALYVSYTVSESSWAQKKESYKKCGWTEEEFLSAFRKDPLIMALSKKNFMSKMDVFVSKMGWQPADVSRAPNALRYSMEKKVIPRCSVIKLLRSNGLLKENVALSTLLKQSDKVFLNRFVTKHKEALPQLYDIFDGKLSIL